MPALAQQSKPGDLVPVEAGTVDTSATQTTLRVMPVELSESTNFMRLYGVAGRPDLLVRSHGGMYAVFDQGQYVSWKGRVLPAWPSGTQFFIGRPDFSRVHAPGIRMGDSNMLAAPGIAVSHRRQDADPSGTRAHDTRPPVVADARVPDQRIGARPVDNRKVTQPAARPSARASTAGGTGDSRGESAARETGASESAAPASGAAEPQRPSTTP